MAGISGWIFMAVGAVVSLFSRYIQKKGGDGLGLFFWAGIIMIGVGIFKIVTNYITREKKTEEERKAENNLGGNFKFGFNKDLESIDSKQAVIEREQAIRSIQDSNILVCSNCGTKHYANSKFCHMCGTRLK